MMDIYRQRVPRTTNQKSFQLGLVYLLGAIFTFQSLFLGYSNSTYLEDFVSASTVGFLYTLAAAISLGFFLLMPRLLQRFGNVIVTIGLMVIIILTLCILYQAWSVTAVVGAFIFYLALSPLMYLNIDVFTETIIGTDESGTGTARGLILVVMSIAGFLAPWLMGVVAGEAGDLRSLYLIGGAIGLLFIMIIIGSFRRFQDEPYEPASLTQMWQYLSQNRSIRLVTYNHFLLQLFFTWAIIYIPLYLATEVGLSWAEIGTIIAVGALAYTLFEFPVGWLADNTFGEKEMMALGFLILTLAVAAIGFVDTYGVFGWAVLMFISRVGCSLIEVTTESYFFKQTTGRDSNLLSLFRMTRPGANLLGAFIGGMSLLFLPFNMIFMVLAVILLTGIFVSSRIIDTR